MNPVFLDWNQRLAEWTHDLLYIHQLIDLEINTHICVGMCERIYIFSLSLSVVVQSLSCIQLFVTPWTAACQASLSSPTPGACSTSCPSSQWCHPIISSSVVPFSPAFILAQHQDLFEWVSSLHQVAKMLEFQLQHQSFQWIFRTDFLYDWLVSLQSKGPQEFSPTPQSKSINSLALSFLYGRTLTSICENWKNHCFDYTDLCWQSKASAL